MEALQHGYTDCLADRFSPWPLRDGRRLTSFECMTRVAVTGDFVSLSHDFAQRFLRRLFPLQHFPAFPRIYEAPAATGRLLSASCTNVAGTLLLRVRASEVAIIAAGLSAAGHLRDEVWHRCI
jgi:hypothetical protein